MFKNIAEIKAANKASGDNWFSPDTIAWWGCRVLDGVYGGRFFVTSEKVGDGPRAYTVREVSPDGSINTVGEFRAYATALAAQDAARVLAQTPPVE